MIRNAKQNWIELIKPYFTYQVLYDSWMYNYKNAKSETIHIVFHNETKSKTINRYKTNN